MNRRLARLLVWLLAGVSLTGCFGGTSAVKEIEEYSPPPLYRSVQVSVETPGKPATSDAPAPPKPAETAGAPLTIGESETPPDALFYIPDPNLTAPLAQAFIDDEAAKAILADGFTLETLEALAWGRNSDIKAAEGNLRAVREAYGQVAALEDTLRQYSAFTGAIMTGVGNMEDMESISKKFPFPGILAIKGDIVALDVRIASADLDIARRTAITRIRQVYWELLYNRRAGETVTRTIDLLKDMEASVIRKYESGTSSLRELIAVQIQKEKMLQERVTIREERRNTEIELLAILNLPPSTRIGEPALRKAGAAPPSPEEAISLALQRRQELKKIRAMISRMELMIEMAETEIQPGFTQNLSLSDNQAVRQAGTMSMEAPFAVSTTASMGAGLPKAPWTGLSEAYLRETRQRLEALRRGLAGAEAETGANVREAWFAADKAIREAALYENRVTALSKLAFTTALADYESGAMPFSDLVDSLISLLDDGLTAERKRADAGRAMAVLEERIGGSWK